MQNYSSTSLKEFFDQDALLFPIEEIENRVSLRDYDFFLEGKHFLKVVDTLNKYQDANVDLDTQDGRDFIVFKRQLYKLYEVRNRSVDEHEAFSFDVERENLKWLQQASQDYQSEMRRLNDIEDQNAHINLKGAVFKRKALDANRLKGFGYFGVAGFTYAFFPYVAQIVGANATIFAISGFSLAGMIST